MLYDRVMRSAHILLLLAACCVFAGVAGAAVPLSPEVDLLPPGELIGPSTRAPYDPTIASNGRTFLVLWREGRTGAPPMRLLRIDGDGTIRQEAAHGVESIGEGDDAVVRSDGTDYLIVWLAKNGLRAQRYDQNGQPSGPVNALPAGFPEVVFSNGSTYLVTERYGQAAELILDRSGKLLHVVGTDHARASFPVSPIRGGYQFLTLPLGCGGTARGRGDLRAVSDDGSVTERPLAASLPVSYSDIAGVAVSEDRMLVAWTSLRIGPSFMTFAVLDREGNLIHEPVKVFSGVALTSFRTGWDGHQFLLMKGDFSGSAEFVRVSREGDVIDPTPLLFSTTAGGSVPSLAASASTRMFVWPDSRVGSRQIAGRAFADFDALAAEPQTADIVSYDDFEPNDVQIARAGNHEIVAATDLDGRLAVFVDGHRVATPNRYPVIGTQ